jgi:CO dehydrogenase/acetyl-CoA synthase delta subunit
VPQISTNLAFTDTLGAWKARWGIGRMSYIVPPGLYALGVPGPDDPVVVTANYKMSYDLVRREFGGRKAWLLVLETHGINVWCAAGKGTFGTGELVRRVGSSGIARVVSHRVLVLPLLGAPGVKALEVGQRTGFSVRFATIRAADLPAYLDRGMTATAAMRELTFTLRERLVLAPVEIVLGGWKSLPLAVVAFLAGGYSPPAGFSLSGGLLVVAAFAGAFLCGTLVTPLLLPWLPTRSFAVKGAVAGAVWSLFFFGFVAAGNGRLAGIGGLLALTAISSFFALNFTGSTPFTSRSGVKKEMRRALPLQGGALIAGLVAWFAGRLM